MVYECSCVKNDVCDMAVCDGTLCNHYISNDELINYDRLQKIKTEIISFTNELEDSINYRGRSINEIIISLKQLASSIK